MFLPVVSTPKCSAASTATAGKMVPLRPSFVMTKRVFCMRDTEIGSPPAAAAAGNGGTGPEGSLLGGFSGSTATGEPPVTGKAAPRANAPALRSLNGGDGADGVCCRCCVCCVCCAAATAASVTAVCNACAWSSGNAAMASAAAPGSAAASASHARSWGGRDDRTASASHARRGCDYECRGAAKTLLKPRRRQWSHPFICPKSAIGCRNLRVATPLGGAKS